MYNTTKQIYHTMALKKIAKPMRTPFLNMITAVAAAAGHAEWRRQFLAGWTEQGTPVRWKKTKDSAWVAQNSDKSFYRNTVDIDEVDIYALEYSQLPSDWQAENKAAAKHAGRLVLIAVQSDIEVNSDEDWREDALSAIHNAWIGRNQYAKDNTKVNVTYCLLDEEEQMKDIFWLQAAIDAYSEVTSKAQD